MARPLVDADPFLAEAERHNLDHRRMDHGQVRDFLRAQDDCDRCVTLIKELDDELSRALINGTGPFGFGA